ncbi:hypothetical protein [Mesorhizobium sp. STM 4661]|nr:hypothetical protein [Mesorhizobium sp. STM 4661]CCV14961.1 hypothetical protein MESS4_720075 [Mesorhizobium sp. STM 4661]
MKKTYEKPTLVKKGKLAAIAAAVVSSEPEVPPPAE